MADRSISHLVKWKDAGNRPEWPGIAHYVSAHYVMAFGLCNAPATFECLLEKVLGDLRCLIYLDDLIVHASTFERELERLRLVLSL